MSELLRTSEVAGLLEEFRGVVREFASREETLVREHRNLVESAGRRRQQQVQSADEDLARQIEEAEARSRLDLERVQSRFAARERRLHDAHASARKQALEQTDLEEGRRKYAVQKATLEAKRQREESLAANDAAAEQFQARLTAARAEADDLAAASRSAFRGMPLFQRLLRHEGEDEAGGSPQDLLGQAIQLQEAAKDDLARFRVLPAPRLFRSAPLWVWIVLAAGLALGLSPVLSRLASPVSPLQSYAYAGSLLALVLLLYFAAYQSGAALAGAIASALARARKLHQTADERARALHTTEIARIEHETAARIHELDLEWAQAVADARNAREAWPPHFEEKWRRAREANERWRAVRTARLQAEGAARLEAVRSQAGQSRQSLLQDFQRRTGDLESQHAAAWQQLERAWRETIGPRLERFAQFRQTVAREFPPWDAAAWQEWSPPPEFKNYSPFGRLEVDLAKYIGAVPLGQRLALPQNSLSVPLLLHFPREGSVLFETSGPGREAVMGALNNLIFRLLSLTPAGKLSFTIFDPVSLGQSFAPVTHLADYEENLINGRIWTQADQLEEKLADLNEHMEKVIQMYLRNEYESIAEYNRAAGNIAEKYHFLVIADFPANCSEAVMQRLLRIAASGARCGVYTLVHWDHRQPAPPDHLAEELRRSSIVVQSSGAHLVLAHPSANPARLALDPPPDAEAGNRFLAKVGEKSRGAGRVEVPFAQITPKPPEVWSLDTSDELRVPIGRSGPAKLQYLALGRGTRQHVLIAGKTGSGKSTLFHVMITNLALWCSPDQVEFYLVDFKKGVEFKAYGTHQMPHARVIAIESDREFGLSVLQRVDEELRRRGELFRQLGVQEIAAYRAASGQPLPRTLLMIDEFQEFFVEEDRVAQSAAMLLDRIVRQGRAFGIHVLLGSQTLGGAYTLARATLGQMAVRIALQSNEADAYLIMDENNAAPRLLSRPGEGIYNDMAGAPEGNSPFQVVWLPEAERSEALKRVRERARGGSYPAPVVFEGNAPADLRENTALSRLLAAVPPQAPAASPVIWLGAPNAIKGPAEVVFHRRAGANLLIVGQRDETALTLLAVGMVTLAAQFPPGQVRFVLLDGSVAGSPERALLDQAASAIRHPVIRENAEADIAALAGAENPPRTFLVIPGLQNFKKLRAEDEFSFSSDAESTAAKFGKLLAEGASRGIHCLASIDTYNNVMRCLGRKGLSEFGFRVLFQMSPGDSASLVDDPKASALGLYRALLYDETEGRLETFRPYARPAADWWPNPPGSAERPPIQ